MAEKNSRQDQIKSLIRNGNIQNQDELAALLAQKGINVTQATLSRDLRQLRVAKVHDGVNGSFYRLPTQALPTIRGDKSDFSHGVHSLAFNGCLMIIKTQPGFAPVIASMLDVTVQGVMMGTVAGDDTIIGVLLTTCSQEDAVNALDKVIPGIKNKLL